MAVVWLPEGEAVTPNPLSLIKVPATTLTKEAITRMRTRSAKIVKSFCALRPMESRIISPTDLPL